MARKKKKKFNSKLFILLLSSVSILTKSLSFYILKINSISFSYSIFLLPVCYLLVNIIYKKSNFHIAFLGIVISSIAPILFDYIIAFSLHEEIYFIEFFGELCAYLLSQFIGLNIYHFMKNHTNCTFPLLYLNYLLSFTMFYMIYIVFHLNTWSLDNFITEYLPTIVILMILCIPLVFIDKKTDTL